MIALIAFLLGMAVVAALAWKGELDRFLPKGSAASQRSASDSVQPAPSGDAPVTPSRFASESASTSLAAMGQLETRLSLMEERFSRLDFQASAASGNASRAEALLIAFSARRLIDRGESLGFAADQLRLRFADAQPRAVETIIEFARNPVTIDQLGARLEALTPDLTDTSQNLNMWQRTRQELRGLFTVRSDSPTLLAPAARIDRARLMLSARRIRSAIDEVERLPGANAANKWIADAQRYQDVQSALDLIETTAMLEPRRLRDGSGDDVVEPSPLATPGPNAGSDSGDAEPQETPAGAQTN